MPDYDLWWMTALVFVPSIFALGLVFFPRGAEKAMLWWTLLGTVVTLGISVALFINYYNSVYMANVPASQAEKRQAMSLDARAHAVDSGLAKPEVAEDLLARAPWVPRFNISYYLGIDGISMALVLLTTALFVVSMIASFHIKRYDSPERFVRGYCMLFLILETGVLGTFVALDFFLFYIFWEVMLLPMYFLIGIWGGPNREYAAIKFFLYTLFGSVLILIALLGFYFTDLRDFADKKQREEAVGQYMADHDMKKEQQAEAEKMAPVNTFDLLVLARAGRGALAYLSSGGDVSRVDTPALVEARKAARDEKDSVKRAEASANVEKLEQGLKERMARQWFFTPSFQITMFLFLFIGFAIKVPMFPFHTWLPDAHVEAPTPISMILAGILLKLGGYGILRIAYPICPYAAEQLAGWLALFGVINIVYGAFAAMAQTDFKKLVAYSSISHMGYVLLGIAVWQASTAQAWNLGMTGAMYQMIAHGITSAGMFLMVGIIYERAHHRNLDNFQGLMEPMPMYGGVSAVIFFAAMGLPGMCGFIGEVYVVLATWQFAPGGQQWVGITMAVLAAATVVLTAGYILWTIQRVFFGTNPAYKNFKDISLEELAAAIPIVVFSVVLGVYPPLLQSWMEPSLAHLVDTLVR